VYVNERANERMQYNLIIILYLWIESDGCYNDHVMKFKLLLRTNPKPKGQPTVHPIYPAQLQVLNLIPAKGRAT
jgi:hypothetical protein